MVLGAPKYYAQTMHACIFIMHGVMHGIMHGGFSGLRPVRNGAWGSKILCTDYACLHFYYAWNYARDYAQRLFGPAACEEWCLGLQNIMHGLCTPDYLLCTELCAGLCTEAFQACGRTLDVAHQMGGLVRKS